MNSSVQETARTIIVNFFFAVCLLSVVKVRAQSQLFIYQQVKNDLRGVKNKRQGDLYSSVHKSFIPQADTRSFVVLLLVVRNSLYDSYDLLEVFTTYESAYVHILNSVQKGCLLGINSNYSESGNQYSPLNEPHNCQK